MPVRAVSEFDLINHYFKSFACKRTDVLLGIGDDCALLQPPAGKQLAMTADTLVAGVHFPVNTSAFDIGYKSLAVNLSDLAAMGAEPAWAILAITLPAADESWLQEFMRGFSVLADEYGVQLIGGDTTSGPLSITVQLTGFVTSSQVLRRDTAKPGDKIYVSGTLGDAALGLKKVLGQLVTKNSLVHCVSRLNRPVPRVALGRELSAISQCGIDISDGLVADLGHIANASGCAANIYLSKLPLSDELRNFYGNDVDWSVIVAGGDDYELCFTLPSENELSIKVMADKCCMQMSCIGEIISGHGIHCFDAAGMEVVFENTGYNHFSNIK
ncbi:MAG: thiamine-monophosphate kinase [Pseudomonadota bacterium]|nr:thiamine-monophosphate kinase [Pseudomonadota bacterium]